MIVEVTKTHAATPKLKDSYRQRLLNLPDGSGKDSPWLSPTRRETVVKGERYEVLHNGEEIRVPLHPIDEDRVRPYNAHPSSTVYEYLVLDPRHVRVLA